MLREDAIDAEALEKNLKVLAVANRIELLTLLRTPHALDDIDLSPGSSQAGARPERTITRQAVRGHLEKLIEAGLVRVRVGDRKGEKGRRAVQEYYVDHARLFAVVDELRKLSLIESRVEADPYATSLLGQSGIVVWPDGLKVVVVRGTHEGKAISLKHAALEPPRGWIVGRAPRCAVRLEYDPYVSNENSEIIPEGSGFRLLDLRSARNGTHLNWQRLPVGGEAKLRSGDIIGVGRSLLLFRQD